MLKILSIYLDNKHLKSEINHRKQKKLVTQNLNHFSHLMKEPRHKSSKFYIKATQHNKNLQCCNTRLTTSNTQKSQAIIPKQQDHNNQSEHNKMTQRQIILLHHGFRESKQSRLYIDLYLYFEIYNSTTYSGQN